MVNGSALAVPEMSIDFSNGILNTLHEYAEPMAR